MHSVQTVMWDPHPPSKHASPLPAAPLLSSSRRARVTAATPAKRITFYKSGDSQFGGVRMAVHKRSFKCFDALLDDLSQKVPLPFGVRTVTTPRGIHAIKHLEQLQDGGCYLCSDRRQAKPINMELACKRPSIWYHHSRRPQRPEASPTTPPGHMHYKQRRILLVKNSEPGMRRSVVLSKRSARSLRAFLDEVSEVMQFHVRKLYTAEGRRIDSVQSLMTCPGVLVCVGREAFSPLLVNFIRKSSEEKLPGLSSRSSGLGPRTPGNGARSPATQAVRSPPHGAQSRASEYSEGHESKKNVNFGLETKKSIIHPRSDSSNRSARFSLSSEKSYGNGVSTCSQSRPGIMNDDIEKRVLVNKDGSLSVEMRVRFRLQNDETIQWSTQIKKSPSLTNECCPLDQAQPHYLQQGQSESCSDPDSTSFEPEVVHYPSQPRQCVMEGNGCPCCYQRQEPQYDLWENPAHSHKHPPAPPPHRSTHTMVRHTHSSSSSSSCNSRRVVRCRAQLSSCGAGSGSEQSQLVQKQMCLTEQVEHSVEVEQNGGTHVEVCKVSRCCSRSEVVTMDSNLRPLSRKSVEDELTVEGQDERPLSAVSASSHVLQSLKEDQDDEEEEDLPPSASQCCHSSEPSPTPEPHQNENTPSNVAKSAASSCHCGAATPHSAVTGDVIVRAPSSRSRISDAQTPKSEAEDEVDGEDAEVKRGVSSLSGHTGLSAGSRKSGASSVCRNCKGCKSRCSNSGSRASRRSNRSNRASPKPASPLNNQENIDNGADDADSDDSAVSTQSNKSNLTNNGRVSTLSNVLEARAASVMSRTSHPESAGEEEDRAPSATSATSHKSTRSHISNGCTADKNEERTPSAMSARSNKSSKSHKSKSEAPDISSREEAEGEDTGERSVSSLSAKSGASEKSHKSNCQAITKAAPPTEDTTTEEDDTNNRASSSLTVKSEKNERPDSVLSAKSAKSNVSAKSRRSNCSNCAKSVSPVRKAADEPKIEVNGKDEDTEVEERATSAMSAKSNLSAKSNKSNKTNKASERSPSPRSDAGGDGEIRATSQMSGRSAKSNKSVKSTKSSKCNGNAAENENNIVEVERPVSAGSTRSHKSNSNGKTDANSEIGENPEEGEKAEERAASALSVKSASSAKSHNSKTEVDQIADRGPSAMSGRSQASAKSSKSQKSKHISASPIPNDADIPVIETDGDEKQAETQDRAASALSVKSKSSVKSSNSHKSSSSKNLSSANAVTINTPDEDDEEINETKERSPSAASRKSNISAADEKTVDDVSRKSKSSELSNRQSLSPKRANSPRTPSPKPPAATPRRSQSPAQRLLPDPGVEETRGPSALSVHSTTSTKSNKSRCRCGLEGKRQEDKEHEKSKENEDVTNDKASERAASALSSSSKRQKRESGGTEQPSRRNSSESVSLGLPEDQEIVDSDSGKSTLSFHKNAVSPEPERARSTMSVKSNGNGRKSASSHNLPPVEIPTIETPRGGEDGGEKGVGQNSERAASIISVKSSKSHKSSCKHGEKAAAQMLNSKAEEKPSTTKDAETESVKSATSTKKARNLDSSAMSSASAKARSKSPASASTKNANVAKTTPDPANNDTENHDLSRPASEAKGEEEISDKKATVSTCCLKPKSEASAHSESKLKAPKQSKGTDSVKSHKDKSNAGSDNVKETPVKSPSRCPAHSSKPCSQVESCTESILSHSLSAADLLKETMAAARPNSRQSKGSDKARSGKSGRSPRRCKDQDLTPAFLPNASPNEVVSDWLRSIPANSNMLEFGDELNEEEQSAKEMNETPGEGVAKEEGSLEDDKVEEKVGPEEDQGEDDDKCDVAPKERSSDPTPGDAGGTSRTNAILSVDGLPRNWQSSVAVMKVLLSSSLGRCRSMPEVSPVYGRRLSTSARGLLDCLTQLQLIEPAVSPGSDHKDRQQQYDDIMDILQSLWLTDPMNLQIKEGKDCGPEQVTPPRSSSGVDMSSGSGGSGKDNETPPKETESLHEDEPVGTPVEVAGDNETKIEPEEASAEQAKEGAECEQVLSEEQNGTLDSPKTTENPSSSDKSSGNSSSKSPTDNERETMEGSSSGTPPTVLRAPLSKRLSQDPDPVWVLNLLKKLEKQFMNHYINAMAEFKVRWDLDDSLILDTMMSELRDEVSRRIQSSVDREMKKIQSRAGRGGRSPRPPQGGNLSRESTMTDKRRRMLKIMKNQSVKTADSLSDGELTGEFSDQRSDDEYCPCDACVRKKLAARPLKANPLAAEAPVMMEFDLLKILQLKKSPTPSPVTAVKPVEVECDSMVVDEEARNLEVVHEEEEEEGETKENIRPAIVLEETIHEEDEEEEEGEGEAGEEEGSSAGDEEQEETGGEEGGEEEPSNNEEEEEEEEGAEEETSNKTTDDEERMGEDEGETGEDDTGDDKGETATGNEDEEESDKDTVKEATTGEGDTTENGEEEECEGSDSKPEEEEESGETGDDDTANADSTPVEELAEGNVSGSAEAEDEDEGGDGTAEEESREDEKGEESEEQEKGASEEERVSPQDQAGAPVCVTEGEEADAEDSDGDGKRLSDEKEGDGGEGEAVEDVVEEEEGEDTVEGNKKEDGALLHQFTRTSVESQPGSLEDVGTDSAPIPSMALPKMAAGGGAKRSRSPARVKQGGR
ncbi:retinitis pigmentosa 1-like 1 protein [Mugil cephalus]|uniref:retinitis pigmentosa 1-like 1 protein n=1 Tax=Mugil cephalus TaxID=48193 RepID=UPI001FB75DC8|nr:retinitis pigmentosa 1-like 1 protein [Mugil cephalus]XP_047432338.1 retinitis pigmentosa 1-like 1 protein [Mugil cephalus]